MRGGTRRREASLVTSALLIADLDSTAQREIFERSSTRAEAVATITGLLRTALLIGDAIYVTDAMILDGAYFSELDPFDVARELGMSSRNVPFVVLCQPGEDGKADLAWSLASRLQKGDGFIWQLAALGCSRDDIVAHGERWIAAQRAGLFEVRPWGAAKDTPMREKGFLSAAATSGIPDGLVTAAGRALADRMLGVAARSDLLRELKSAGTNADDALRQDLEIIEEWWLDAYLRELAIRNGAGWVRFVGDEGEPRGDARQRVLDARKREDRAGGMLALRGRIVELVTAASPPAFGSMRFAVRAQRERLQARPTRWHLTSLTFAALSCLEAPDRTATLAASVFRAGLATAAALASSTLFDIQDAGIAWLVGVLVLVTTLPWEDFLTAVRVLRVPPAARVKLHELGSPPRSAKLKR